MTDREKKCAITALELALKYLEHPDVQAINFALHASIAARRVEEAIIELKFGNIPEI